MISSHVLFVLLWQRAGWIYYMFFFPPLKYKTQIYGGGRGRNKDSCNLSLRRNNIQEESY